MKGSLRLLGTSPSKVARHAPEAATVRETGYEVTDFAGLFTAPKARFLTTVGAQSPQFVIMDGIEIKSAGSLSVPSGRLVVFDPCDHAYVDKTVRPVTTPVPRGDHETFVALRDGEVLAVAVVFAGDGQVEGWLPALLGDPPPPMPTPPMFSRPAVRFSLGLADAKLVATMMNRVLVGRAPDGSDPTLEHLRKALSKTRVVGQRAVERKGAKSIARHDGVIAVDCSEPPTAWMGLDGDGKPRALVFDFDALRRQTPDRPPDRFMGLVHRVSSYVSGPGILLDLESVTERFRAADAFEDARERTSDVDRALDVLMEQFRAAGHLRSDPRERARSFLARIKACGKKVEQFEPTIADDSILDMPIGLARAASTIEVEALKRAASAATEIQETSVSTGTRVDELEISVSATNALGALAIETVGELTSKTEAELLRAIEKVLKKDKARGRRIVKELVEQLAERGFSLRQPS